MYLEFETAPDVVLCVKLSIRISISVKVLSIDNSLSVCKRKISQGYQNPKLN